ncbi:MAG: hypothetical protein AAF715_10370 [Myxococcota bacterium]
MMFVDEHSMVTAYDLLGVVAHGAEKVLVGVENHAVEVEGDDGMAAVDGGELPFDVGGALLLCGDVGGVLDHPHHVALVIQDGVVGGLNPYLPAPFRAPFELCREKLARGEAVPKRGVRWGFRLFRVHEDPVVSADDLLAALAHCRTEGVVGADDGAVGLELDHGQRAV